MTVYVDEPLDWGLGSVKEAARVRYWCHMFADTLTELHEMADKIGMRRSWFQGRPNHVHAHYDLTKSRRALALSLGAKEAPKEHTEMLALLRKVASEEYLVT